MKGVYLRGNIWWIRYRFNGELVRKPVGKDRLSAELAMAKIRKAISEDKHREEIKSSRPTFSEMKEEYLKIKIGDGKRSLRCDRLIFKKFEAEFGGMIIDKITEDDVKDCFKRERCRVSSRTGKRLSAASVNRQIALLRNFFNVAKVRPNPVTVKMEEEPPPRGSEFLFEEEELRRFWEAAAPHLKDIITAAVGMGQRKSDILELRWDQVNLKKGIIRRRMKKTEGWIEVPIMPEVREFLEEKKKRDGASEFVFTYKGRPIKNCKTAVHGAFQRAGLTERGLHFHDLRLTFASMVYGLDGNLLTVRDLLGHKSVKTTERYLGVSLKEKAKAVAKMNPFMKKLLGPQKEPLASTDLSTPSVEEAANPSSAAS